MDTWEWAVLIALVVVVVAALVWAASRRRTRNATLERFGPEYERAVLQHGDRRAAEQDLVARAERRRQLDIVPLSDSARARYVAAWEGIQGQFVDRPESAIDEADRLLDQVMRERGYPVDELDDPTELVSVDHPHVIEDYRTARAVRLRNQNRLASTDELRSALLRYRSLFDALLHDRGQGHSTSSEETYR